jgi:site-specific recombinase XerC
VKAETNNYIDQLSREIAKIRNKAILTLMLEHDLELNQVMEITLSDIDVHNKRITIKPAMASMPGYAKLSHGTAAALANYLRVRSPSKEKKLFLSEGNSTMSSSLARAIEQKMFS